MERTILTKPVKEKKETCTFRMCPRTREMLSEIKAITGISRSEILAQLVKNYYNTNIKKGGK